MTKSSKRPQPRTLSSRLLASVGGGLNINIQIPDLSSLEGAAGSFSDISSKLQIELTESNSVLR
jgi:hypothetical protein